MKLGDKVVLIEPGPDFGKMCTIIEMELTTLPRGLIPKVKIKTINPYDPFIHIYDPTNRVEKWVDFRDLKLVEE